VGAGERERIGPGPVVGHLTSATLLERGAVYRARGVIDLRADAEVALRVTREGERLEAGDLLITGSVVQVPIEPGDEVIADLGPLGRAELAITQRGSDPPPG
jgi:hypothetical protein